MHRETHHQKPNKRPGQTKQQPKPEPKENKLEGEGSYEAGRNYDEDAREFVREGGVEPAAADARRALDEDPESMRRAEQDARRGPRR